MEEIDNSPAEAAKAVAFADADTFTRTVRYSMPGSDPKTNRECKFTAEFELIPQDEWEDLTESGSKSDAVRRVLRSADDFPPRKLKDGTTLSPLESAIRNPKSCDAAFTAYWLYTSEDGRNAAQSAASAKNSRRSRAR